MPNKPEWEFELDKLLIEGVGSAELKDFIRPLIAKVLEDVEKMKVDMVYSDRGSIFAINPDDLNAKLKELRKKYL